MRGLIPLLAFFLLALAPSHGADAAPASTGDSIAIAIPDLGRLCDTWLWVRSDGIIGVSTPQMSGTHRTLILHPDMRYELHQRRAARDTTLCQGIFTVSEQTSKAGGRTLLIEFGNWIEKYEEIMLVDFETPNIVHLAGYPCQDCPEHVYARGRSMTIDGEVKRGERFRADLWDGREFDLSPAEFGWEIAVRDTARPAGNLARLTPQLRIAATSSQRTMDFIFSPEVGRSIQGKGIDRDPTVEEIDRVSDIGWGTLAIRDMMLGAAGPGRKQSIESLRFTVTVEETIAPAP
jgi:hypothetical protein